MTVLVTGFGPFGDVHDNPASRVARAVDGTTLAGHTLVGREIPVSYRRGLDATVDLAREHAPVAVLGIGVAVRRSAPQLERFGRARLGEIPDVDGVCAPPLAGPDQLSSSLDLAAWSAALGCEISEDAGSYVCNAWLHQMRQRIDVPVGFLHIPRSGVEPTWLLDGLRRLLTSRHTP